MKRFLFEDALKTDRDNVSGLDIANVNIEHLPKEVFEFKNLKGLFLKSTNIEEIPEDINKLENLELFSLYVTPPRSIDLLKVNAMLFQLSTLPRIKRINITANLMNWPSNLFLFHNLNILNLGSNQLREIPAEISCLSKLKEIDISSNKVSLISPSIGSLTRLKKVNLKGNLLATCRN
jgi:Leucine-rich repeat (LRR) protein